MTEKHLKIKILMDVNQKAVMLMLKIRAFFVIMIIFLIACQKADRLSTGTDIEIPSEETPLQPSPEEERSVDDTASSIEEASQQDETKAISEIPERTFTLEQLKGIIKNIDGTEFSEEVKLADGTFSMSQGTRNTWAIHTLDNGHELKSFTDFYRYVRPSSWDLWKRYINQNTWNLLHDKLGEDEVNTLFPSYGLSQFDLSPCDWDYVITTYGYNKKLAFSVKDYEDYSDNHQDIEWQMSENAYKINNLIIPEFQMLSNFYSKVGTWEGAWERPILIYKIPCSTDTIVYYFPKDAEMSLFSSSTQKRDTWKNNWDYMLSSGREGFKSKIMKVLDFCGVDTENVPKSNFLYFSKDKHMAYEWRVYYRKYFNHSFDVKVSTETRKNSFSESPALAGINLSFISFDESALDRTNSFYKEGFQHAYLGVLVLLNDSGEISKYTEFPMYDKGATVNNNVLYNRYHDLTKRKRSICENYYDDDFVLPEGNISLIIMPYLIHYPITAAITTSERSDTVWWYNMFGGFVGDPVVVKIE